MSHLRALIARSKHGWRISGAKCVSILSEAAHMTFHKRFLVSFSNSGNAPNNEFSQPTIEATNDTSSETLAVDNPTLVSSLNSTQLSDQAERESPHKFPHVDSSIQGFSIQTAEDGTIYEGHWLNGRPHGQGKLIWSDLSYFVGAFERGLRHGPGEMSKKWGITRGTWMYDRLEGPGKTEFTSGAVYEGDFYQSRSHGQGKLTFPNGTVYVGEFAAGRREGHGTCTTTGGSVWEGVWTNDQMTGEGVIKFASGTIRTGTLLKGAMHGEGRSVDPDGTTYIGEWQDGMQHGRGLLTLATGEVYIGSFVSGYRHGYGTCTTPNSKYEGEWRVGGQWGKGKLTLSNGVVFEGNFVMGKLQGEATATMKNGGMLKGNFSDGKMCGYGTFTYPNGTIYEGTFVDGLLQGVGKVTSADGTVRTGPFVDGAQHGEFTVVFSNGEQSTVMFEDDLCKDKKVKRRLKKASEGIKESIKLIPVDAIAVKSRVKASKKSSAKDMRECVKELSKHTDVQEVSVVEFLQESKPKQEKKEKVKYSTGLDVFRSLFTTIPSEKDVVIKEVVLDTEESGEEVKELKKRTKKTKKNTPKSDVSVEAIVSAEISPIDTTTINDDTTGEQSGKGVTKRTRKVKNSVKETPIDTHTTSSSTDGDAIAPVLTTDNVIDTPTTNISVAESVKVIPERTKRVKRSTIEFPMHTTDGTDSTSTTLTSSTIAATTTAELDVIIKEKKTRKPRAKKSNAESTDIVTLD